MNYKDIERSIIKKFRKEIYGKFVKGVNDFNLIEENDRIMVCMSGGKDSFLLAKCLEEICKHGNKHFTLKYVVMDPGYSTENLEAIKKNAIRMNIDIEIFESNIFNTVEKSMKDKPCYMCARMRRGYLYNKAKELNCNKIALGHHFNDVIETILLSMFYNGYYQSMLPKLKSKNFEGIELIRPLYYVKEEDIIRFAQYNNLKFLNCGCAVAKKEVDSKRLIIKELIKSLKDIYENIDINIFKSSMNVNLNTVISYIKDEEKKNYLDEY